MQMTTGPFPWPLQDEEVQDALNQVFNDGSWGKYHGPECENLTSELCDFFNSEQAVLCSSGTIGVELALRGCGVQAGDEVVLAGYDFPGNFRAIEAIGARPVLVDVNPNSWSMEAASLAGISREKVKAVIVSHLHGGLANMPAIIEIARNQNWFIVEDACQQPGATIQNRQVVSWGDVGVLSFGGSKLLTAGRGGALLTSNPQIAQRMKVFADRGNQAFPLSELQAAVLRPQLRKLAERNRTRRTQAIEIINQTHCIRDILRPVDGIANSEPTYYKLAWSFSAAEENGDLRDRLVKRLVDLGVPVGEGFRGFTERSQNRCEKPVDLSASRKLSKSTILLHHPILLAKKIAVQNLTDVLKQEIQQSV